MFILTGTFTALADEFSGDGFDPNLPASPFFAHSQAVLIANGIAATVFGGSNITFECAHHARGRPTAHDNVFTTVVGAGDPRFRGL